MFLAIAITEPHTFVIGLKDGGVGEGDAIEVAGEIAQRLVAGADGFGVNDPGCFPELGRDCDEDFRVAFFEKRPEPRPEDGEQGVDGDKEANIGFTPGTVGRNAPPVTRKWMWGWYSSWRVQVWSTAVMPGMAGNVRIIH